MAWTRYVSLGTTMVAAVMLAGCSGKSMWHREGINKTELRRDQANCVGEAGDYDFLAFESVPARSISGGGRSSRQRIASRANADIYQTCMQSKGYSKGPAASE